MVNNQVETVNKLIELVNISGNSITSSRRRIIAEIARQEGLFTSEELAKALPNIGRATVYRTLRLLYEIGTICRINIVDEHSYYAISLSDHHHHTVCKNCNKIEEINECCVFGISDEYWGNKVCMEVYLSKNITSDEIKKRLKDLDNFKIPKEIFFSNQNLPKLNNGKIDRKKISQKYYE